MRAALTERRSTTVAELRDVWFRAEADARAAYAYWRRRRDAESYAVYRACADRADGAQDELARWQQ